MSRSRRTRSADRPLPFAFLQRHYRASERDDLVTRWLAHPAVARGICRALLAAGVPDHDIEDALSDVLVRVVAAFQSGARVPPDLRGMMRYCANAANHHAIDVLRSAAQHDEDLHEVGDPDESVPIDVRREQRDPIDAARQLEILAALFREGKMPERGLEILVGVADGCSAREIAEELGIGMSLVHWRLREMRRIYRVRLGKLGILVWDLSPDDLSFSVAVVHRLRDVV